MEDKNIVLNIDESQQEIFNLYLNITQFDDDKQKNKYIKKIERLIRISNEYKLWTSYIKEVLGYNYCHFTNEISNEVTIEIHHHPFTLYDLVTIIIDTYLWKEEPFNSFNIALEVLKLHYTNKVGYIPLVKTLHEKFHNGHLNIPIDLIHGDWKYIVKLNKKEFFIQDFIMDKISLYCNFTTNTEGDKIEKYKEWYNQQGE